MKKIEAIIRHSKVAEVHEALEKVGHPGMMITELEGHGTQNGVEQTVRGKVYKIGLMNKARLEIVVKDTDVKKTVSAIREAALTGKVGDGKIFIYPVENAIRIRTNEEGDIAL